MTLVIVDIVKIRFFYHTLILNKSLYHHVFHTYIISNFKVNYNKKFGKNLLFSDFYLFSFGTFRIDKGLLLF